VRVVRLGTTEGQLNMATGPKILSVDIETSPVVAHAWGLFKQNIAINQIIERPRTMCFGAKFLGERKVHWYSEHEHGPDIMFHAAHALLDEADVVMHYNGDRFDLPRLNTEFVLSGLTPPSPYKSIDLLKVVRRNFNFPSNKLAYISEQLGLTGKVQHEGHQLWIRCLAGDPAAWKIMRRYNVQDVKLLEELYEKLKPWIAGHPNFSLYNGVEGVCPNCGDEDLERRGYAYTSLGKYQRLRCKACGTWTRGTSRLTGATVTHVR
jgi:DNA polymerase elongation subunit (family B)